VAMMPPGPGGQFDDHRDLTQTSETPDFYYVAPGEAKEDDKVTWQDKVAIMAALGLAQLIRLFIIFAAFGLIALFFVIASHL
jgi:hypothetical protein